MSLDGSAALRRPRLGVLLVTTQSETPLGADVWVHAQIARALNREWHDVHVACVPRRDEAPTPFVKELGDLSDTSVCPVDFGEGRADDRSSSSRLRALAGAWPIVPSVVRLARYVRRHRISIIHTTDRPRDAMACVIVGRLTRTPCVIHAHVVFRDWIRGPLRWALRRADARIGVSDFVARSLIEGGHAPQTTFAALNAIDVDSWTPGHARHRTRAEFGVSDDDVVVICACRLFPAKGPRELIRAIADVRSEVPRVHLWIVGDDVSGDQSFGNELHELVRKLDLADQVVFAGRRSDMAALMAGADVYAMPSFEEPFGLVFAEAMAMALPVVALDNGGTREIVVNGETGLLSEPGDHQQLVDNLLCLLRDPVLRSAMGQCGRARVMTDFTVDRLADDVARIYRVIS